MATQLITIGSTEIPLVQYQNQPVVTFAMIDKVHQRPEGTASRNFRSNRDRFIEGKHFFYVTGSTGFDEIRRSYPDAFKEAAREATLITERGYLKLVKSLNDDLAWDIQEQLIDGYFRGKPAETLQEKAAFVRTIANTFGDYVKIAKLCGLKGNHAVLSADRGIREATGVSPLKMIGAELQADPRGMTYTPTELGQLFNPPLTAIKINKKLELAGLQGKEAGHWIPTDKAIGLYEWLDTGKKHSDGTPIKQLKWFQSAFPELAKFRRAKKRQYLFQPVPSSAEEKR